MNPLIFKSVVCQAVMIASVLSFLSTNAQVKESSIKRFYFQGGAGIASKSGSLGDLGLQIISRKHWVTTLSYTSIEMEPKNLPSDYTPAFNIVSALFIPFDDGTDHVKFDVVSLTMGKEFKTGRNTWFTAEAGLAYVNGETMSFHSQPVQSDIFSVSSNYASITEDKSSVGGVIKADINWAFASFMGLGGGLYGNLNSIQSVAGFEIKLMVGMMGRQKKNRVN